METKLLLSDLLTINGIDPKDVLLIRHALSDAACRKCYEAGFIHEYTQLQTTKTMTKHKYWMTFISTKETKSKFIGMFVYEGKYDISEHKKLSDFPCPEMYNNDHVFYKLKETDLFGDLKNKLIIEWGTSTQSWYQKAINKKSIVAIQAVEAKPFPGYDDLVITHDVLESIVNDVTGEYQYYRNALANVLGVYLILDTTTGNQYIGSASGNNGLLERWTQYAKYPYHGGNTEFKKMFVHDNEAYKHFQFSILQIFSKKTAPQIVRDAEDLFKKKLGSKVFGLNDN